MTLWSAQQSMSPANKHPPTKIINATWGHQTSRIQEASNYIFIIRREVCLVDFLPLLPSFTVGNGWSSRVSYCCGYISDDGPECCLRWYRYILGIWRKTHENEQNRYGTCTTGPFLIHNKNSASAAGNSHACCRTLPCQLIDAFPEKTWKITTGTQSYGTEVWGHGEVCWGLMKLLRQRYSSGLSEIKLGQVRSQMHTRENKKSVD